MRLESGKTRALLTLTLVLAVAYLLGGQAGAQIHRITAIGSGSTRAEALTNAYRNAVEEAIGSYVHSNTIVENYVLIKDKIVSSSAGYIKNSQVLHELVQDGIYSVKVECEVEGGTLKKDLIAHDIHVIDGEELYAKIRTAEQGHADILKQVKAEIEFHDMIYPIDFAKVFCRHDVLYDRGDVYIKIYDIYVDVDEQKVALLEKWNNIVEESNQSRRTEPFYQGGPTYMYRFPKLLRPLFKKYCYPPLCDDEYMSLTYVACNEKGEIVGTMNYPFKKNDMLSTNNRSLTTQLLQDFSWKEHWKDDPYSITMKIPLQVIKQTKYFEFYLTPTGSSSLEHSSKSSRRWKRHFDILRRTRSKALRF